jgi:TPR repeat protein
MSLWDNIKNTLSKNDCEDEFLRIKDLAEQGDANAQNELGIMYEKGKGVAKNYTEAWKWYSFAIKQRHTSAADNRTNLALHVMTRAQGAEVDTNMKLWIQNTFENNKPALEARIKEITEQHIEALRRKYEKAVYKDDYGNVFYDKWDDEFYYFLENVILNDRKIKNLLWDLDNPKFPGICRDIINNII